MENDSNLLTVIAIIIALAAYIATVRARILDKARQTSGREKEQLKSFLRRLLLADIPLVISGLILSAYAGLKALAHVEVWPLLGFGFISFACALLALAGFHAYEWYRSLTEPREPDPNDACVKAILVSFGRGKALTFSELVNQVRKQSSCDAETISKEIIPLIVNLPPARLVWPKEKPLFFVHEDGRFEIYDEQKHKKVVE